MKKKEKIEWIIRYAKNNKIESILSEKYLDNQSSVFKRYSSEIQSICALLSVVLIGLVSLMVAIQSNGLIEAQNRIMKNEHKPIIVVREGKEIKDKKELIIVNRGGIAIKKSVDVVPYIDVNCLENGLGYVPIRAYLFPNSDTLVNEISIDNSKNDDDIVSKITLLREDSKMFTSLNDELAEITSEYADSEWFFLLTYLIRVKSIDVFDEESVDYYIYNSFQVKQIGLEDGDSIYDEYLPFAREINAPILRDRQEPPFFIDNINAKMLFRYSLKKIREKGLYYTDPDTSQKRTYGEYEPKETHAGV